MTAKHNKKINNIIIVLGHYNDDNGELTATAKARCEAAKAQYDQLNRRGEYTLFLCTGGANDATRCHDKPHAEYMGDYLKSLGVPAEVILSDKVDSHHTLADAELAKAVVENLGGDKPLIYVTTSEFHIPRAMATFRQVFEGYPVMSCIAPNQAGERNFVAQEVQKTLDYFPEANPFERLTQREMALAGSHVQAWNDRRQEHLAKGRQK